MLYKAFSCNLCRFFLYLTFNLDWLCFFEHLICCIDDILWVKVSCNSQHHVVQVIESIVTTIKQICVNLCNRFHCSGDIDLDAVFLIHAFQKVKHDSPTRIVIVHSDFLGNNSLFLFHCLFGKVRIGHKVEQNFNRLSELVGTCKQITGLVKTCKCICRCTGFGIAVKRISILTFKHLMFQIVGNSRWYCYKILVLFCFEADIDGTILGRKHRIRSGEPFHWIQQHGESRWMFYPQIFLSNSFISHDFLFHPIPPPFHPAASAYKRYPVSHSLPHR